MSFTLARNQFPPVIQSHITCIYSELSATITTSCWSSSPFCMSRGVFQGDRLSPLIFILCCNPILALLKLNSDFGYKFNHSSIVSLPYADNFNLITANKSTRQRLITRLNALMRMKLEKLKCSSLSIVSGAAKPTLHYFSPKTL